MALTFQKKKKKFYINYGSELLFIRTITFSVAFSLFGPDEVSIKLPLFERRIKEYIKKKLQRTISPTQWEKVYTKLKTLYKNSLIRQNAVNTENKTIVCVYLLL